MGGSTLKAASIRPGRADVSFELKCRKKADVPARRLSGKRNSLLLRVESVFLFYLVIGLLGGGPPILGRDISFMQFRFKC